MIQILAMDDGTFPALLKTLSDSSEEVRMEIVWDIVVHTETVSRLSSMICSS